MLGQQGGDDMPVLFCVRGGQGRQRAGRQTEVEANAVDVAPPDPGSGCDQQLAVDERLDQFLDDRQDGVAAPVHDRVAPDFDDVQPGQELYDGAVGHGQDELAVEESLAHQGRRNVDDFVALGGHGGLLGRGQLAEMMVPTCSPSSARSIRPGLSPLMICTEVTWRAWRSRSRTGRSITRSGRFISSSSSTVTLGMKVALLSPLGLDVYRPSSS